MKKTVTLVFGLLLTSTTLLAARFISKATAEKDALQAVHGGTVVAAVLESTDKPPRWSVDIAKANGTEDEVWVDAYTGRILAIIRGN
jgi:uncharacterized membrane protein YkoI